MKIETIDENGTYQTIEAVQADRITFGHHEPGKARLALVSEGRGIYPRLSGWVRTMVDHFRHRARSYGHGHYCPVD